VESALPTETDDATGWAVNEAEYALPTDVASSNAFASDPPVYPICI
jgi:hypothetical protein